MTDKEIRDAKYHYTSANLIEEQHQHIGKLRVYGHRFMGIAWG